MNPRAIGFYLLLAVLLIFAGLGLYGIFMSVKSAIGGPLP